MRFALKIESLGPSGSTGGVTHHEDYGNGLM